MFFHTIGVILVVASIILVPILIGIHLLQKLEKPKIKPKLRLIKKKDEE